MSKAIVLTKDDAIQPVDYNEDVVQYIVEGTPTIIESFPMPKEICSTGQLALIVNKDYLSANACKEVNLMASFYNNGCDADTMELKHYRDEKPLIFGTAVLVAKESDGQIRGFDNGETDRVSFVVNGLKGIMEKGNLFKAFHEKYDDKRPEPKSKMQSFSKDDFNPNKTEQPKKKFGLW